MTQDSPSVAAVAVPAPLDPAPLVVASRNWSRWVGPAISLLVLVAVIYQLRFLDLTKMEDMIPKRADFWISTFFAYAIGTIFDWLIFRRLWRLPASGIIALARKKVSNDLLFGYLGEVYFYTWARRHSSITTAPFGAIKDVAILSALAGNVVTLLLVLLCWPFANLLKLSGHLDGIFWSILFVLSLSLVITLLRNRLFSLPARELWIVTGLHLTRIFASLFLVAYMWWCMMPSISLVWLLLLNTMRLLISRLPFLPNKDLAFAAIAVFLVGHENVIVSAIALTASLFLAANLLVGAIVGGLDLLKEGRTSQ